ncbi:hypothetical protein VFPFJ_06678 [Purpureocillium lilacinum]|uniref:Uncharacterized protein n=1 Tax=Purpureocillium lilacinum TaxID=33203 RepID=A0A179HFF0_PURLI|nr:hypothetical protein VFPFJ_06678 [Purpureocillium lilacinum]KAK4094790.1 hypothetical protein Purlil1_486 [Purpureocillium lilacinum]OAQ88213.1 hypothetical protein VFPFJ_06678 [Purpureocillium lilacinum]GJN85132.1 hypothetical protein PLIIFM63780_008696 [Purpureocillium lilacinum]
MAVFPWSDRPPADHQLPHDRPASSLRHRLAAILVFFTHRIWRGGPRLILQLAACVLIVPLLLHLLPTRLTGGYRLSWSTSPPRDTGALRIVVFGSQDVTGSSSSYAGSGKTWTEQLCSELDCSSYQSFVPDGNSKPALTSNGLYGNELHALQEQIKTTDFLSAPAKDYEFLLKQYPVPMDSPDLEAQVKQFLALPPPENAPRNTLWVFTFGTWDVWNLAAFPRVSAEHLVDALVSHLFAQIELLYLKALNPTSVAFSDFWANATESDVDRLADPKTASKVDRRELESFRIIIPHLADMTIAPGWQQRPVPSYPHSKAEQMRNADFLTRHWNSQVKNALESWNAKGRRRPDGIEEENVKEVTEFPKAKSLLGFLPSKFQPEKDPGRETASEDGVVYAPYPRRAGLQLNLAAHILDAMTDEELRRSGLKDSKGRGTLSANDSLYFVDTWTPCTAKPAVGVIAVDAGADGAVCEKPDDHLYYDGFTLGQRAIRELAGLAADKISHELFASL